MPETRREGGCACGAVRIVARGEPWRVGICHCLTCRRHHGAPFGAFAIFPAEQVEVSGGELGAFADSAHGGRWFCKGCGSPVFGRYDGTGEIELYLGSFDPNSWSPTYELWIKRREAWLPELPTILRRYEGNRPETGRTEP